MTKSAKQKAPEAKFAAEIDAMMVETRQRKHEEARDRALAAWAREYWELVGQHKPFRWPSLAAIMSPEWTSP